MEHFFAYMLNVVTTALLSPAGLLVTFTVALTGELGVSPPAVLQAAFVGAGVRLANGSFDGLVLFPVVILAALVGTTISLTLVKHGVRVLRRFIAPPEWAQSAGFLQRLPQSSPITIAVIRQLPGSQLPFTTLWEATGGPWDRFYVGVALSVILHGVIMIGIGATTGSLVQSSGAAFGIAFGASMLVEGGTWGIAHLIRRSKKKSVPATLVEP